MLKGSYMCYGLQSHEDIFNPIAQLEKAAERVGKAWSEASRSYIPFPVPEEIRENITQMKLKN